MTKGEIEMKTLRELAKVDARVYVYVGKKEVRDRFLKRAEEEGFTFGDGVKPLEREAYDDIYALNPDGTLNFVGFAGHLAFRGGRKDLVKIEYEKWEKAWEEEMESQENN